MTGTFKSLSIARVIDRTGQVCALLPVSVVRAVSRTYQNRRVAFRWVMKIQSRVWRQSFRAIDARSSERGLLASVQCSLAGESSRAYEQGARSQAEKIAELSPRDLCFFTTFVRKLFLIWLSRRTHVALVGEDFVDCFLKRRHFRIRYSCPTAQPAYLSTIHVFDRRRA